MKRKLRVMKKLFSSLMMFLVVFILASCGSTNPENNNQNTVNPPQNDGYSESVDSILEDGVDYISHADTYNGKNFTYNEQGWYINSLDQVPLPDPHIYGEDGVYYIVGTCDANNNIVACYTTTDFNTYEYAGEIFNPASYNGWEREQASIYAPEMYCFDGVYYLYYSALNKNGVRKRKVLYKLARKS